MRSIFRAALVIILAGAIMYFISFALGTRGGFIYFDSGKLKAVTMDNHSAEMIDVEPFSNLVIDVRSIDVELIEADDYKIEYQLPINGSLQWELSNGALNISEQSRAPLIFSFGFINSYVKVYYPADADIELADISIRSGNIKVNKLTADSIHLKTTSGTIRANVLNYSNAKVETDSGSIHFSGYGNNAVLVITDKSGDVEADISGCINVDVNVTSGKLICSGETVGNATIKLLTGSGNIISDISSWQTLTASTKSGRIAITGKPTGTTSAEANSGDIVIKILGSKEDFSYSISTRSGTIRIDGNKTEHYADSLGGSVSIEISTRSGNIHLDFVE